MTFFFYLFAILSVLSAVCVISVRNPVHAVLFLIFAFVNASALFILLGAEFIAMMVLIVYIGAVAVLFLFIVMMLDIDYIRLRQGFARHLALSAILSVVFFLIISFVIRSSAPNISNVINYSANNVKAIGNLLYTDYMYAFHLSGILLLVAIVGAIALTLQDKKKGVKKQNVLEQLAQSSSVKLVKAKFGKGVEWK
ncbi:NADH-quinone oxidoreductase subunit J [Wolbachia endosymbiont of Atemnus politus]|uniref:NADH-quinone oxidoreductase subunit J n=1 Tax=Wolbachia endosymbiont of Atemnus politus TaxID=2682840 RepID=UPI00157281EB|nr:NADH-quinone oxidoreductase subunit J [Wolbachia endosymbiont of Atemnus politus]NSM56736.1 NADH-quinone oxidoreductase subunit J [Wolbachia endosymbiont of Atemnus politus]NSX83359.1 NADH-quinone oxidoreductase subunit J [Wolbachia endosymbiont of Atemnus politus]